MSSEADESPSDSDDMTPVTDMDVPESVPAIEEKRVLIGFMGLNGALPRLKQAEQVRNPIDPEKEEEMDDAQLQEYRAEQQEKLREKWETACNSKTEIGTIRADQVTVEDLPDDLDIQNHLNEYTSKDAFQEVMNDVDEDRWSFKRIPIDALVAFQPQVTTTAYEDIPTWGKDPLGVLEYCFPTEASTLQMTSLQRTDNGSGFRAMLTSRSPNFHIAAAGMEPTDMGRGIHIEVRPKVNFLQVARYNNRYILKNGYHRTYQLMRAGETHVPAVIREVDRWDQTGGAKDGFFTEQLVMSERPPTLPDYLSDAAVTMESPGTNTLIEVTAETKQVPR